MQRGALESAGLQHRTARQAHVSTQNSMICSRSIAQSTVENRDKGREISSRKIRAVRFRPVCLRRITKSARKNLELADVPWAKLSAHHGFDRFIGDYVDMLA